MRFVVVTWGVYGTPTGLPLANHPPPAGICVADAIGLVQMVGALAGAGAVQVVSGALALPPPPVSQYSAYCSAVSAAFRARCFSRRLPAIFSSSPKLLNIARPR